MLYFFVDCSCMFLFVFVLFLFVFCCCSFGEEGWFALIFLPCFGVLNLGF